jgi:hypothetical protein
MESGYLECGLVERKSITLLEGHTVRLKRKNQY